MNPFEAPIIGPFVERNGRAGPQDIGAAISWTSKGEAYCLDVIRLPGSSFRGDVLGFLQNPEINFDEFLCAIFNTVTGVSEFLNELRPFFRPPTAAPNPARAAEWLHSDLVARGFSLGAPKLRKGNIIRTPILWVFGG